MPSNFLHYPNPCRYSVVHWKNSKQNTLNEKLPKHDSAYCLGKDAIDKNDMKRWNFYMQLAISQNSEDAISGLRQSLLDYTREKSLNK